jgi:hypothetical protein
MIKRHLFISKTWLVLGLIAMAGGSKSPQLAPRDVLQRFCELDAKGKQLDDQGSREIAALFVRQGDHRPEKVVVIRDFVVSLPSSTDKKKAEFYVEYIYLGQIDLSNAQFSRLPNFPLGPSKVRSAFNLVSETNPSTGPGGSMQAPQPMSEWRIDGSPPEPHLTIAACISYIKQMRDKTADPAVRKNAEKTLVALGRLR